MKHALVLALATMSLSITLGLSPPAFAQSPNLSTSPGPHDPAPPMNSPDLRLPPPCAPTPNLAVAGAAVKPVAVQPTPGAPASVVKTAGDTQCSANTLPQSSALPSGSPLAP